MQYYFLPDLYGTYARWYVRRTGGILQPPAASSQQLDSRASALASALAPGHHTIPSHILDALSHA